MQAIHVGRLRDLLTQDRADDVLIVDVRTPGEHRGEHILGVSNLPLEEIATHKARLERYKQVYVHCNSGNRSSQACQALQQAGLQNIVNVEGGLESWKQAGFPIVTGKGTISVMRQVQVIAGTLTLLGMVLGKLVHPRFFALSAFVGAGLTYAGASGNCMMAQVLGRMPWNK